MTTRILIAIGLLAGMAAVSGAQSDGAAPRTPWGDADLQGIWGAGYILTPLERPDEYEGREFLTDEEVAVLEGRADGPGRDRRSTPGTVADVEGAYNDAYSGRGRRVIRSRRTSLIVDPPDGRIPFTPEGRARWEAEVAEADRIRDRAHHPEDQQDDRCEGITLPLQYGSARISGGHSRVVQAPGMVSFYYESGHQGGQYRDVFLDVREPLAAHIRQWFGRSVGRWEGDTLVVEASNFSDRDELLRLAREPAAGRAVHPRRAGPAGVPGNRRGPGHLRAPVDRRGAAVPARQPGEPDLRVGVPGRQLRHDEHPRR